MNLARWRLVDHVFQATVELDGDQREQLLRELCGVDVELRCEVEELLRHDMGSLALLDRVGGLLAEAALPIRPGASLGEWTLGSILGEGGSGIVFEARALSGETPRRAAIKVLKTLALSARSVDRFRRECALLARLEHPHIAQLNDAGTTEQGLPYLVLERVEGLPIHRWAMEHQPPIRRRLALFEKICLAVAFAHSKLVVHRDLKPSNILVTAEDQPKLLDFGIARVLADSGPDSTRLTKTRAPLTPQWASPEQLRGDDVTTASDVYSLGLVLYELLTGELPYTLSEAPSEDADRLLSGKTLLEPPSSIVERGDHRSSIAASDLRGDLDRIVMTALALSPEHRYSTAAALRDDLERYRLGLPIAARPPSSGYLLRRFIGRHRVGVAVSATLSLLMLSFAASMGVVANRLRIQEERARHEASTAAAVTRFLSGLFEGAEPSVHRGRQLDARELLDRGATDFDARAPEDSDTRAALAEAIGKAYLDLSEVTEAKRFLEQARALRPAGSAGLASAHLLLARAAMIEADFSTASRHSEEALGIIRTGVGAGELVEAEALLSSGRAQLALGDLERGIRLVQEALSSLDSGTSTRAVNLSGLAHTELGGAMMKLARWTDAERHLDQARSKLTSVHGPLHPQVFDAERLSCVLRQVQRPGASPEGPEALIALLERQRQVFGDAHEQMMWTLTDIATTYTIQGDDDLAEPYYRQAMGMETALMLGDHLVLAVIHAGLGQAARRKGDLQAAATHFRRSLSISEVHFAENSLDLAYPRLYLGQVLSLAGKCEQAKTFLERSLAAFERDRPEVDLTRNDAQWSLGFARHCLGDPTGAEMMQRSLALATQGAWTGQEVSAWIELTPRDLADSG